MGGFERVRIGGLCLCSRDFQSPGVSSKRSRAAVIQIPLWVFVITCILEFLQLWHPRLLEEIRATLIGKWLLGTTFVWWDFPYYALGCVLGWLWLRQLQRISYAKKSQS
ncbi:DUF2809 domain-containing protein [aff. Roholtiella sp. LEGE 12411]|nr:DUF2809 domain-containing protein [aff. Roholtiella sp. LEGE 12411]